MERGDGGGAGRGVGGEMKKLAASSVEDRNIVEGHEGMGMKGVGVGGKEEVGMEWLWWKGVGGDVVGVEGMSGWRRYVGGGG